MKYCLIIPSLLLSSTLFGCTTLFGAAYLDKPSVKLQSALDRQFNLSSNGLFVSESHGVLSVRGFVKNLSQKNAVERFVDSYAVNASLDFEGRIESKVALRADYDCRASDECVNNGYCLGDTQCNIKNECYYRVECL